MTEHELTEPSIRDVLNARRRMRSYLFQVAPRLSEDLSSQYGREVWLIPECLQRTGSFKFRGALNRMLMHRERDGGPVITASSGNHAIGLTVAAAIAGVESTVFVPEGVSEAKLARLRALGANVLIRGSGFDDTENLMFDYAGKHGIEILNSFDPDVIAGHATAALDAIEWIPDLTALLAPVASGGLLAGCAIVTRALAPDCRLFGVQTAVWPAMHQSMKAGTLVDVVGGETVADGLVGNATRSSLPFQLIRKNVSRIELVDERSLIQGVRHGLIHEHLALEGAGAATIAAALAGQIPTGTGPVGLLLSGSNGTEALFRMALEA